MPATPPSVWRLGLVRLAAVLFLCVSARGLVWAQGVTEYPLPGPRLPEGIAAGPDGALWFTESTGKIGRITTSGVVTEFSIPGGGGSPACIAAGPDGNLWFTEGGINKIGRITTSGVITEFPVPTANGNPKGITSGPDGALWFTESGTNKIGRISTSGAFLEFVIPTPSAGANQITAGPDGRLWFTERGANKIGRITTAGAITDFSIPTPNVSPEGIVAGPDGNLWFGENSGGKIGRVTTAGSITEFLLPVVTRVFTIAAGSDGNVWFSEFDNNKIGRITPAGVITEYLILTADSGLYGMTSGPSGHLWFTEFRTSKVGEFVIGGTPPPQINFEYPLPGARLPEGITSGPDSALWFTETVGRIGRSTTSGGITEFTISGGGGSSDCIASGPDGNLWFTEGGISKIGRITTSGVVTEFPAGGSPKGITSGPDGALWFTESDTNKIGRITTAGAITEFTIPTSGAGPNQIALGPDGNLWFTERGANKIGRITPAGAIVDFSIPTAATSPEGIAAGPDGNLWFSENAGNKIGRVTPSGSITEFPLPSATRVFTIASGADGNLWFSEFDGNRIGRITTSGVVTEFLIPTTDSGPYGVAAGPDGNIWFTEFKTSKIGWVATGGPPPPTPTPPATATSTQTPTSTPTPTPTPTPGGPTPTPTPTPTPILLPTPTPVPPGFPVAGFGFLPSAPLLGDAVQFTDTSSGNPFGWSWDFGDPASGAANVSTQRNPMHVFAAAGSYAVSLTASNGLGSSQTGRIVFVRSPSSCPNSVTILPILAGHPFCVSLSARDQRTGRTGLGQPFPQNDLFGYFALPTLTNNPDNPEVFVKILDGRPVNGHLWVFYGGLTDLEYTLTVEDMSNGAFKSYHKDPDNACGGFDTLAFSDFGAASAGRRESRASRSVPGGAALCTGDPGTLCLNASHAFFVSISARDQRTGRTGTGLAIPSNDVFGYFSIPDLTNDPRNPEVFVKVLDGRAVNGFFWVFYSGLTDLEYTITVQERDTGRVRRYLKPAGSACGGFDTTAF